MEGTSYLKAEDGLKMGTAKEDDMEELDITKVPVDELQFRDGRGIIEAVYTDEDDGIYVTYRNFLGGAVFNSTMWERDGEHLGLDEPENDIIRKPKRFRHERWVNVYEDFPPVIYRSRAEADAYTTRDRVACVKAVIEGEHGEGLE